MMIPNYINSSSPSPFVMESSKDHDQINHQFFVPNYQSASSSSSLSCHVFFNSSSTPQDQTEFYPTMIHHPPHHQEVENQAGSYDLEKKDSKKSLKLTLWKNHEKQTDVDQEESPAKWMSSKMRVMQKMKNSANLEDQNKQASSSLEADHLSSNSSSYHTNPTIRVCADCNTTKTPLWRSGPQGPKSLCNACGIRQRKARRAMAAAAANNGGRTLNSETATTLKIKVQNNKEKINNSVPFKKRCKMINSSESSHQYSQKNNVFEDFLFNLSKNLAFQRVFPQDEKEAAILLMALSCGLVHG